MHHDEIVCGNVEPLEEFDEARKNGVSLEESFVVEANDIIVVDMVPKMLVTHVLIGAVRRATKPAQEFAELGIVLMVGDGKIFVTPIEQVWRIRTGETGDSAL